MRKIEKLTKREKEVLSLVALNYSNSEIAKKLYITIHTVKKHMESVSYKLKVTGRTACVVLAIKLGIIDVDIEQLFRREIY